MSTRSRITLITAAAIMAIGLAGCTSGGSPTATATKTVTTAPSPTVSTPSSTPTTTGPPSGTGGTRAGGAGSAGSGAGECATANLRGSTQPGNGGGTAGSTYVYVRLTNTGSTTCTIQGWPGVSIVGGGNGTQIGQAAAFDRTSPHSTVSLATNATALALLRIVEAGNYDASQCVPTKGDGLRIYPPGQKASLYIPVTGLTGCKSMSVSLLTVDAFQG